MKIRSSFSLRPIAQTGLIAILCASTAVPAETLAGSAPAGQKAAPLSAQQRALHVLNRFTFGPRPGELDAVAATGTDAWFERQLHPARIDDAAFEQRLNEFPALKLSIDQLMAMYPGPQTLRLMERRGIKPADVTASPAERAIYSSALARYQVAQELMQQGKTPADIQAMAQGAMQAADQGGNAASEGMMAGTPEAAMAAGSGAKAKARKAPAAEVLAQSSLTPEEARAIVALAPEQRFQRILALSPADLFKFARLSNGPMRDAVVEGMTPQQKEVLQALGNPMRVVAQEALEARLLRDVYSERQVEAVMTDFWLNHFSVYVRKNQIEPYLLNAYQRDAILPNALGNFEQLLIATAESPAMLVYLDNWQSIGPNSRAADGVRRFKQMRPNAPALAQAPQGINENYARELMELHTVGVNGGYTQRDVVEVAKCFTGWTIERPYGMGGANFRFDPARHEGGSKVVMGVTIPEGGMQEGLTVLHLLATSPKTAHFISQKLAVRFVSDEPPTALVERMASTFESTHGDIKAVLETMYHSPEFWSPGAYRAKVKTPVEFLTSALRASGVQVEDPALLVIAADRLGMPVYGMQTPNGYSWQSADWVSTGALVNRMNFALVLSGGRVRGVKTDWAKLSGGADPNAPTAETEQKLEAVLLGQPASPHTRSTVLEQSKNPNVQHEAQKNFSVEVDEEGNRMGQAEQPAMEQASLKAARDQQRARGAKGGRNAFGGGGLNLNADAPESPLDTMAGLLIGSPEFQRR